MPRNFTIDCGRIAVPKIQGVDKATNVIFLYRWQGFHARAHRRLLSVERPIAGERPPLRAERHEGLFFPAARRQPLSTAAREPNANSDRAKLDTERTRVRRPHAESFSGAPYAGSRGSPRLARVEGAVRSTHRFSNGEFAGDRGSNRCLPTATRRSPRRAV